MGENTPVIVLPSALMCSLRTLIAEYEPETTSAFVVADEVLERLGSFLGVSFTEEGTVDPDDGQH